MNQFILGGGDPVLAGTQIDEQIQLLEGQKQLLMARQRQNATRCYCSATATTRSTTSSRSS